MNRRRCGTDWRSHRDGLGTVWGRRCCSATRIGWLEDGGRCRSRTDQAGRCRGIGCMDAGSGQLDPSRLVRGRPYRTKARSTSRKRLPPDRLPKRAPRVPAGAATTGPLESRIPPTESVAKTIDEVAEEIDAGRAVYRQRGRGATGSALLGSALRAITAHTKPSVLIAPPHPLLPVPGVPRYVSGERYYAHPDNALYTTHRVLKLHGSIDWLSYTPRRVIPTEIQPGQPDDPPGWDRARSGELGAGEATHAWPLVYGPRHHPAATV
jgi:hypothetical protein